MIEFLHERLRGRAATKASIVITEGEDGRVEFETAGTLSATGATHLAHFAATTIKRALLAYPTPTDSERLTMGILRGFSEEAMDYLRILDGCLSAYRQGLLTLSIGDDSKGDYREDIRRAPDA